MCQSVSSIRMSNCQYCPTCTRRDGVRQLCEACKAVLSAEPEPVFVEWSTRKLSPEQQIVVWQNFSVEPAPPKHRQQTSPCGRWVAKWHDRDDRRLNLVVSSVDTEDTMTFIRNGYHLDKNGFGAHWFTDPADPTKSLLLYNPAHSVMAVIDPTSGCVIASQADKNADYFILDVLALDDPHKLLVCGWVWHPLLSGRLFDLKLLLEQKHDYKMPVVYDEWYPVNGKVCTNGVFVYGVGNQAEYLAEDDRNGEDSVSSVEEEEESSGDAEEIEQSLSESFPPAQDTLYSWKYVQMHHWPLVNNLIDKGGAPHDEYERIDRELVPNMSPVD